MKAYTTAEIRKKFLEFFEGRGHTLVPSSPLVPGNDPTLLFTNAGMVQFKDVFLGHEQRPYQRACSVQRCLRAGGKHNDLENVGYTARHHTFFEMLGNFSFGDYFKREAIRYAWEFLTEVLEIPKEKLWISVYETDYEAEEIWLNEIGIDPQRISRCDAKDNFWSMGDTGPCGPCSEIFYDHGETVAGGPPGSPDADGDRYIEIWNLVFMQYNRDAAGNLTPLPKPSVDTGMGLERIAAVLQSVHNNYEIDVFRDLIRAIDFLLPSPLNSCVPSPLEGDRLRPVLDTGVPAQRRVRSDQTIIFTSKKVLADHIRSTVFLIHDGVLPSNEGRGYVLRRIIRRALRHGHKLGFQQNFFHRLVPAVLKVMQDTCPELDQNVATIEKIVLSEEEQFSRTLSLGLKILDQALTMLTSQIIPGDLVFKLYDTYGFPVDLTADIAREKDFEIDYTGFQTCMQVQRQQSQAASQFVQSAEEIQSINHYSEFAGYDRLEDEVTVVALFKNGVPVDELNANEEGWIVLNRTPFYAEGGGQVGDQGQIIHPDGLFEVTDTRHQGHAHLHIGRMLSGTVKVDQVVTAAVDGCKRHATALNHTATHLLHAALRRIIGAHVIQKGSLVEPARLRFDFSHFEPLKPEQIKAIESLVNQQIRHSHVVDTTLMSPEQAKQAGAMALFGEKYAEEARVLSIGNFSKELCGGTHVKHTGEIGLFKMTNESAVASGVRRIEAVTGEAAMTEMQRNEDQLHAACRLLNCASLEVEQKLTELLQKTKQQEKITETWIQRYLTEIAKQYQQAMVPVNGIDLLVRRCDEFAVRELQTLVGILKSQVSHAVIVLATAHQQRAAFVVVVHPTHEKIKADELAKYLAGFVSGKGGGKPQLAQAGGADITKIDEALTAIPEWLQKNM